MDCDELEQSPSPTTPAEKPSATEATPKSSPGEEFVSRSKELITAAANNAKAVVNEVKAQWSRPVNFVANLFDVTAMSAPFKRDQHENEFKKAVTDPKDAGTIGDLAMSQLQGDMLGCMERAFRSRHHTAVRSRIHPAARLAGHGAVTGPIGLGMIGQINSLDKQNKGAQPWLNE